MMHGGGLRLGRRLGQAVKGGTGESLGSRNQTVQGEQAVERGKGESLESWEHKVRERKGRARRGARARRAAPDLEATRHQVTVNASGGQINDKSNALDEIEREEEVREAEVSVPAADCAPKNAFGSPSRALLGEIVSYRPDGSAHALPEGSALE